MTIARAMGPGALALAFLAGCGDDDANDRDDLGEGEDVGDAGGEAERKAPVCWQGSAVHEPCGNCGLSWSACGPDGQWEPFGDCEGSGPCAPGALAHRACAHCGTQTKTCTAECAWTDWSECVGEGECWPGQQRSGACGDCGTSTETCSDACRWPARPDCRGDESLSDLCADGNDDTQDRCEVDGSCEHWDLTECPLGSVCCGGDTSACGDAPVCADWRCDTGTCALRYEADGTDPEGECAGGCCDGLGACSEPGVDECCGSDVGTCGNEPVCADWRCDAGSCELRYEADGTDPEAECGAGDCCDGQGSCRDCPGCPNVECLGVCCDEGERCCRTGCQRFCGQSDRDLKGDFASVDPEVVLESVAALPISTWSYLGEDGVRHMGPMAQDFRAAFGLGDTDRLIYFLDEGGVALAAIQALRQRTQTLRRDNEALQGDNARLRQSLRALEQRVETMERGGRR